MLVYDDGFEELILARKMVVDAPKSQVSLVRDLAHGCCMVALLQKELDRRRLDNQPRRFPFRLFFLLHRFSIKMNERSFLFYAFDVFCQEAQMAVCVVVKSPKGSNGRIK